ncbi:MAG: hypothetical protein KF832_13225 [Caldilineaceae bacterium]|nr:hypothetical protein [Caldilineaceae bacterium]
MAKVTVELTDEIATRIAPIRNWLSTVLELSLIGFKTPAVATATEIIEFLASDPSPQAVLNYQVSASAQERLQRLLMLNTSALLSADEQRELDELEKIEHIFIMLKAQVATTKHPSN